MTQSDVMRCIAEGAKLGAGLSPQEAVSTIAGMINGLDVHSGSYEVDVIRLLKLGATILDLSTPGGAHDPTWVPTFLQQ